VDEFEDELVAVTRVPHGRAKAGEIDGMERCHVPLMDGAALFKEVFLGGSFADVVLVMTSNRSRANAELDFGGWSERDVILDSGGVAVMESASGFVSIYI